MTILKWTLTIVCVLCTSCKSTDKTAFQECERNVNLLGNSVVAYQVDTSGRYPQTLKQLSPKYIKAIPVCPLTLEQYTYKVTTVSGEEILSHSAIEPNFGDSIFYVECRANHDNFGTPKFIGK